jgi:hypothetical protein
LKPASAKYSDGGDDDQVDGEASLADDAKCTAVWEMTEREGDVLVADKA